MHDFSWMQGDLLEGAGAVGVAGVVLVPAKCGVVFFVVCQGYLCWLYQLMFCTCWLSVLKY
jgi:hypothetical protein